MRRIISICALCATAFAGAPALAMPLGVRTLLHAHAAARQAETCFHDGGTRIGVNGVESTCTEDGYTGDTVCEICGEILAYGEVIPALGHQMGGGVLTWEPTATENGVITYCCTRCGEVLKTEYVSCWDIDENGVLVGVDLCGATEVVIPQNVTAIGANAFSGCDGLTSVTIGNSVTSIGWCAFYDCSGLTSVTIGNRVTSIGESAFYGCSGLESVTIPDSVTSIGESAFYGCRGLESVTIPDSVTSIGSYAFLGCSGLTSVAIPDSVTRIGGGAFEGCDNVREATVPGWQCYIPFENVTNLVISEGTTSIGEYAFSSCTGLTSVTIPDSVTSIGNLAFYDCSGLTSMTIGNSVTSIGYEAFDNCRGLTSVTIPDSVTSIGGEAFFGCSGLTSVTIPDSVTSIGVFAFYNCSGLTSVTIPDSVTSIGSSTFYGCSESLFDTTTVPGVELVDGWAIGTTGSISGELNLTGVRGIAESAFYGCSGLTSVTIPDSVTSIGNYAFEDCSGLTSVTIPDSVTSIGDQAFYNCRNLTSIHFQGNAPTSVDSFYNVTAYCVGYVPRGSTGWGGSIPGTWHGLRIEYEPCPHNGGTRIGVNRAESTCAEDGYTGDTVCDICDEILASGESIPALGHVEVETKAAKAATCTEAGWTHEKICSRCHEILAASVPIPALGHVDVETKAAKAATCTEAGWTHEMSCSRCHEILAASAPIPALGHVDVETKTAKAATCTEAGWTHEMSCSRCHEVLVASVPIPALGHQIGDGVITQAPTLAEDGVMTYYCTRCGEVLKTESVSCWHIDENGVLVGVDLCGATEVVIPQNVTAIGANAFYGCSGLTSVTIPDSVTSIGANAFGGCGAIETVVLPIPFNEAVDSIFADSRESIRNLTLTGDAESVGTLQLKGRGLESEVSVRIEVRGTGRLSFRWKASSEYDSEIDAVYDYAFVTLDGEALGSLDAETYQLSGYAIGGETDWVDAALEISGEGVHTVTWTYRKDEWDDIPGFEDCIWLDGVSWEQIERVEATFDLGGGVGVVPEAFSENKGTVVTLPDDSGFSLPKHTFVGWSDGKGTYAAGAEYVLSSDATVFTAQWIRNTLRRPVVSSRQVANGEVVADAASVTLELSADDGATLHYTLDGTVPNAESPVCGSELVLRDYAVDIRVIAVRDDYFDSEIARFSFTRLPFTLAECLGLENADRVKSVSAGGDGEAWHRVLGVEAHDGVAGLRSGAITHSQTNWVEVAVAGPGRISFWWNASSESVRGKPRDGAVFFVDGAQVGDMIGGTTGEWRQVADVAVEGDGVHTVRWIYAKSASDQAAIGEDCAWLDDVVWTPAGTADGAVVEVGGAAVDFEPAADGKTRTATVADGTTAKDVKVLVGGVDVTRGFRVVIKGRTATIALMNPYEVGRNESAAAEPWSDNGDGTVTLNVEIVPGLYYAVGSAATLEGLKCPGADSPARPGDALSAQKQAGAAGFYRVWVADKPLGSDM